MTERGLEGQSLSGRYSEYKWFEFKKAKENSRTTN